MHPIPRPLRRLIGASAALFLLSLLLPVQSIAQDYRADALATDYAHSPLMGHLWHWRRFPVRVFVATHDAGENQAARVALAGFGEWVTATQGVIRYEIVNSPAQADITVRFVSDASLPGQPGVAGETRLSSGQGIIRRATMVLATGDVTAADFQAVAAHEFGHALGIGGHSDDPNDLMYPVETRAVSPDGSYSTSSHPITLRDLNTLRFCYPGLF